MENNRFIDAATRREWLARLEVDDKVKGPFLTAIADGDIEGADQLLTSKQAAKKDIRTRDIRGPTGLTALHLAALFGDDLLVTKLIENKADPNVTSYCQITSYSVATKFWMDARPLLFAIGAKNLRVVEQLLTHGSAVDMNDAWPLFSGEWWQLTNRFAWKEAQEILHLLMQRKLDVNHRVAILRWSLLHYCVNIEPRTWTDVETFLQDRYDTIEYLLDNGANPLLKDTFGRTPYSLLEERSSTISNAGLSDAELRELQRLRDDADGRLKQLLQKAMVVQMDKVKSRSGVRGSFQRLIVRGQNLDRIPLLSHFDSLSRRASTATSVAHSQTTAVSIR